MKALAYLTMALLICSCQKELISSQSAAPAAAVSPDPAQVISISQFAPMLWENKKYSITAYYSEKENLWNELPSWVKDDVFTFNETGKASITANADQDSSFEFDVMEKNWKLYAVNDTVKLDWLNAQYEPATYSVVAYKSEESFTLSIPVNDSLQFYTYTLIK